MCPLPQASLCSKRGDSAVVGAHTKRRENNPSCPALPLELQLQGKLDLPRRPEVARWASRAGNDSKSRIAHTQVGIAEVHLVKEVEEFRPELCSEALVDLGVLHDGEIRV